MACNPIPRSYPSLILHITEAEDGASAVGASVPVVINSAILIGEDRQWLINTQKAYRDARSAIVPFSAARRTAVNNAYNFCYTARGVLEKYLGRDWSELWIATGWETNLAIPLSFADLYELTLTLKGYFTSNPTQENEQLGVTAAAATAVSDALRSANLAVDAAEQVAADNKIVRDNKMKAVRKRLKGLCKELSMRLDDLDPRWRRFGFNLPGAASVPEIPENVVVTPLPAARLQIACDHAANATGYRFFVQRPILDPEPIFVGHSTEPLFVTEPLTPGQTYVVYVSATNEGAESDLSDPVGATPVLAAAA